MTKVNQVLLAAGLALGALASCQPAPATLTGEVKGYTGRAIECIRMENGQFIPDSVTDNGDGTFVYSKDLPEGGEIWLVAEDARGYVRAYLKNGDQQHVVMSASADSIYARCDATFSGDAKASEYLLAFDKELGNPAKWTVEEAGNYATFTEYSAVIAAAAGKLSEQLKATGDQLFIGKEEKKLNHKVLLNVFNFTEAKARAGQPTNTDKDFISFVEKIDYNDMDIAKAKVTNKYIHWYQSAHPDSTSGLGVQYFRILKQRVSNQEVVDYLADNFMANYMENGADAYPTATIEAYQQTTSDPQKAEKYKAMSKELEKILPGKPAPDFDVKDVKGKAMKFSDIIGKGKVVYMDVWATWCGPCCAEIPFMEKLVERYAGNSKIEIISLSIDENTDKWSKKLEADQPEWRQFIVPGGFKSDLCRKYRINGIPRFMLFDKEGKIIDVNAPLLRTKVSSAIWTVS